MPPPFGSPYFTFPCAISMLPRTSVITFTLMQSSFVPNSIFLTETAKTTCLSTNKKKLFPCLPSEYLLTVLQTMVVTGMVLTTNHFHFAGKKSRAKIFTELITGVLYITQLSWILGFLAREKVAHCLFITKSEIQRELLVLAHKHSFQALMGKFWIDASPGHLGSVCSWSDELMN